MRYLQKGCDNFDIDCDCGKKPDPNPYKQMVKEI